jgi:hypothetical protein
MSDKLNAENEGGVGSSKLFPCPFCGEQPEYAPRAESAAHPGNYWPHQIVHDCKTIGQQICVRSHPAGLPDSKESVFGMWNTRSLGHGNE